MCNSNIKVAEQIIYSAGFSGLLYATYMLVFDLQMLMETSKMIKKAPDVPRVLFTLLGSRHFIGLVLLGSVVTESIGTQASTYILFGMNIFLILEITLLNLSENAPEKVHMRAVDAKFGARHGVLVLLTISTLLVLRELFFTVTTRHLSDQDNEKLWYPFAAVMELLAAMLFTVPSLVPIRDRSPSKGRGRGFLPLRAHRLIQMRRTGDSGDV